MRKLLTLGALASLAGCGMGTGELRLADRQRIEQEVQLATDSVFAAASRTDMDGVFGLYADAMHADQGALHTLSDTRAAYADIYAAVDTIAFTPSISNVHVLGPNAALWVGQGNFRAVAADTTYLEGHAAWSLVWERENGDWMIRHIHQSIATPAIPE